MRSLKNLMLLVISSLLIVSPVFAQVVSATVSVSPVSSNLNINGQQNIAIVANGVSDMGGYQFSLVYNPAVVEVDAMSDAGSMASTGRTVIPLSPQINNTTGLATFGVFSFGTQAGITGNVTLANITIKGIGSGQSNLTLQDVSIVDTAATTLPVNLIAGNVSVAAAATPTPIVTPTTTATPTPTPSPTPVSIAHLTLTGIPASAHLGDSLNVNINLDTNTLITGSDVILTFDQTKLQATGVTDNHLLPSTPKIEIHNDVGVVKMSQVVTPGVPWLGSGQIFSVGFSTIALGNAALGFDYTPGLTTDSNIIADVSGLDILQSPASYNVTILAAVTPTPTPSPTPSPTPTPTATPSPTPTQTPLPLIGDINHDGIVNNIDLSLMYDDWFGSNPRSDLNLDGVVNTNDFRLLAQNFLKTQ